LDIRNNASLNSLFGLDEIATIGGEVQISNNAMLPSLDHLNALTSISDRLLISDNPSLTSLDGLGNLEIIGANLTLALNATLASVEGLESLTTIGGSLVITDHEALASLAGLSALTSMDGFLQITFNQALTSLEGLEEIDPTGISELFIESNQLLSNCAVESICAYISSAGNTPTITVNAEGCNSQDEVVIGCMSTSSEDPSRMVLELSPNPTSGRLQLGSVVFEQVQVFTPQGRLVSNYSRPGSILDLSDLPAGLYYLRLESDTHQYSARIVKR
ncbi:MAG: T9SS type A sorting domain-containing protein, partial [Bacteroidota bacterium]